MRTYRAPHQPNDKDKLQAMMETLKSGKHLPPIVVCGEQAFCGSHRIAAYEDAWRLRDSLDESWELVPDAIQVVELSDDDYRAACIHADVEFLDDLRDYNEIARAIRETTTDDDVKAALADQMD
jgi:hypothetical protein